MKLVQGSILFAWVAAASAAPPPIDFMGLVPGQKPKLDSVRKEWQLKCDDPVKRCTGLASIGGARAEVLLALGPDGALDRISLDFDKTQYEQVTSALESKFGAPSRTTMTRMTDYATNTPFDSETRVWQRPDGGRVSAFQQGKKKGRSAVEIASPRRIANIEKELMELGRVPVQPQPKN